MNLAIRQSVYISFWWNSELNWSTLIYSPIWPIISLAQTFPFTFSQDTTINLLMPRNSKICIHFVGFKHPKLAFQNFLEISWYFMVSFTQLFSNLSLVWPFSAKRLNFYCLFFLALSGAASISCWASPIANNLPLLRNFWESSGPLVSYHAVQHLVPDQGFQNMQKIHNRPKGFAQKTKIIPRVP